MGPSSSLGKFIKQYVRQRGFDIDLKKDNYRAFILQLMAMLEQADYLKSQTARSEENDEVPIYRLRLEKIIWKLGDGETVKADVVKQRAYKDQTPKPNKFFQDLYQRDFAKMKRLRGEDHTGQLGTDDRIQREERVPHRGDQLALLLTHHGVGDRHSQSQRRSYAKCATQPGELRPAIGPRRTKRPSSPGIYLLFQLLAARSPLFQGTGGVS